MVLPMILCKAGNMAKQFAGNGVLLAKKYAPEIMIGTGITGFGVTIYKTVKATNKTNEILDEKEQALIRMDNSLRGFGEEHTRYTHADYENDLKRLNRRTRRGIARAWIPVATLGVGSVVCVLGGYHILNGRYVATAAAYKMLENTMERYRQNVRNKYGEEEDLEFLYTQVEPEAAEAELEENRQIAEENKKHKFKKKKTKNVFNNAFEVVFDAHSPHWMNWWTPRQVIEYLKRVECQANDRKAMNGGHIFLNEIYDMLDAPRTTEGAVIGYIGKDVKVDFGFNDMPEDELRDILAAPSNAEIRVPIRMKPTGLIYDKIE